MSIERLDSKDLYISKENYTLRKKTARIRLDALKEYLTTKRTCRSLFLLSYFGETGHKRCGQCDVCLERNKAQLSELEFDKILQQIKPLLKERPYSPEELLKQVKITSAEKTHRVLEWLLDNDKIYYNSEKKLSWKV
jgi:ATP-dependent DNA helicase RecQ